MSRTIHTSLSVRGALRWDRRRQKQALKWLLKDDGSPFHSVEELRDALLDALASGNEMLPFGECDGFDPKTGCPGHATEAA